MSPSFFTEVIHHYLPEPHASILNGILFGVAFHSHREFYNELKMVGLVHIVVLSGTNITLLVSLITQLTIGLGKRISVLITLFSVIFFVCFVGIQAPAVRAGIMSCLTLVATLSGRKVIPLYGLLLSGILSVCIWNNWLTSLSFQLSYAATLGLILFNKNDTPEKSTNFLSDIKEYCICDLKTSLSAQVFTVPLIFIHFHQISLIAPLANLLISWIIAPLMVFGFMAAILGKIHFLLGLVPSYVCFFLLSYLILIVKTLSRLPFIFIQF